MAPMQGTPRPCSATTAVSLLMYNLYRIKDIAKGPPLAMGRLNAQPPQTTAIAEPAKQVQQCYGQR